MRRHRFIGFKPYRHYSITGDPVEPRITDFMPEHQIEVADRYGLIIRMHIAKSRAIADPENLEDLERLTQKYPRVRWMMAHCARSYSDWPLLEAAPRLKKIPNLWFETSSVCESDAFAALLSSLIRRGSVTAATISRLASREASTLRGATAGVSSTRPTRR